MMLRISDLHAAYGKAEVLHGIDLEVAPGEVVCLIGRNGVGKSSTMKSIVRDQIAVTGGEIVFDGAPLAGMRPHEVIRRGVGYVPEDRRVFASLSVLENLNVPRPVAAAAGRRPPPLDGGRGVPPVPAIARLSSPQGRGDERGRAADAVHRPVAADLPEASAARRAA
ncbi:ATP-binding cassette domain-containing protein [Paracoccus pantotrophus]|uniref:ATP-binding cassette domain-containing protein n=1 Tax=Paracoccus pantotrophus TaxID=82367 RepID=UPI000A76380B